MMLSDPSTSPPHSSRITRHGVGIRQRRLTYLSGAFCLLLLVCGMLLNPTAALPVQAMAQSTLPPNGDGNPPLVLGYGGEKVIQYHPKVYLVFWGSKWKNDTDGVIPQVQATISTLAGSSYNNMLSQYKDGSGNPDGHVHNDVQLMGTWIDASSSSLPSDIDITNEVGAEEKAAVTHFGLPYGNSTAMSGVQIMVFPQNGTSYLIPNTCGMHYFDTASGAAYSMIAYSSSSFCNFAGYIAGDMARTAVHEYAETATDPVIVPDQITFGFFDGYGWQTSATGLVTTPEEVADLCNGYDGFTYTSPSDGQSFFLPYLWSNADNGCVSSVGKDYWSSISGKHTVQHGILNKYQALSESTSILGFPSSEETPIAGGAVSYFVGPCSGNGPYGSCGAIYWSSATGAYGIWGGDYTKYLSEGGPGSNFGFPTSDPQYQNGGAVSYFRGNGNCSGIPSNSCYAIFSSSAGNWADWGGDLQKYYSEGGTGGYFGWPTSDPQYVNGGAVSFFQGTHYCSSSQTSCAALYSSSAGNFAIWGGDMNKYLSLDPNGYGTGSNLGWLTSDPQNVNGGAISHFQKGAIYSYSGGNFADWGNDYNHYVADGGPGGNLGWPTTDPVYQSGGAVSTFQSGAIYDSSYGTFAVWGNVYNKYLSEGGLSGSFGWPQSDPQYIDGGAFSEFQGSKYCGANVVQGCAAIYDSSAGTVAIWGNILQKYLNLGGVGSGLGWPTQDPVYVSGGAYSPLQSGAVYDSNVGTYEVNGAIYQAYVNYGGPGNALGFPVTDEYTNTSGYRESDFQHGNIVWENGPIQITLYGGGGGPCTVTVASPNVVTPNSIPC